LKRPLDRQGLLKTQPGRGADPVGVDLSPSCASGLKFFQVFDFYQDTPQICGKRMDEARSVCRVLDLQRGSARTAAIPVKM
jgi:hypothetical protein